MTRPLDGGGGGEREWRGERGGGRGEVGGWGALPLSLPFPFPLSPSLTVSWAAYPTEK